MPNRTVLGQQEDPAKTSLEIGKDSVPVNMAKYIILTIIIALAVNALLNMRW